MMQSNKALVFFMCFISLYAQAVLLVLLVTNQTWLQACVTSLFGMPILILCGVISSLNLSIVSLVYSSEKSIPVDWLNVMVEHIACKANVVQPEVCAQ